MKYPGKLENKAGITFPGYYLPDVPLFFTKFLTGKIEHYGNSNILNIMNTV